MTIFDQLMQEEYDSWCIQPPEYSWCTPEQTRLEVEFLKKTLCLTKTNAILDLQCSWGRHALILGSEGYNVTGVDISEPLIDSAKKRADSSNCNAIFAVADFRNMRFKYQFDVVYQVQSSFFEAWRTPEEVRNLLLRVWKILKSKGRYLFGWKDDWCTAQESEKRWRMVFKDRGITTYDSCELPFYNYGVSEQSEIVHSAGFTITAMYNTFDCYKPYHEGKPGLVVSARKEES